VYQSQSALLLQTDSYLEQLTDTVAEAEMSTQTDPFRDRPSTPLFIPAKAGLDATTQIEAGDLFDFDFEVCIGVVPCVCLRYALVLSLVPFNHMTRSAAALRYHVDSM